MILQNRKSGEEMDKNNEKIPIPANKKRIAKNVGLSKWLY